MGDRAEDLRGHIDGLEFDERGNWVVNGWACDNANFERMVEVEVLGNGIVLGTGRAGIYRDDVRNAGIGSGNCGFAIVVRPPPPPARGKLQLLRSLGGPKPRHAARECHLSLRDAESGAVIVSSTPVAVPTIVGYVDNISGGIVSGWVLDLGDRGTPTALDILVGDKVVGRVVADRPRNDLVERFGVQIGGFQWAVPVALADGRPLHFVARVAQSEIILPNSAASDEDLLAGDDTTLITASPGMQRRYLANVDGYYRVTRQAIERIAVDRVVYYGHAGSDFAAFLAGQFASAQIGRARALTTGAQTLQDNDGTLCVVHLNASFFTDWCLSGEADQFLADRIAAHQPTILSVETPDSEGGLRSLNTTRAREWCEKLSAMARTTGMEPTIANTLIDFFYGHPGFVLSLAMPTTSVPVEAAPDVAEHATTTLQKEL